jgi:ATP-dependent Lhr-like helicase
MNLPYRLYGAAGQQFLSIIGSLNGSYTRVADLHNCVKDLPHIGRDTVEDILSEYAYKGVLKHHGFKNRYGGDEDLYKLIDYRLIHGNFPQGSKAICLKRGSQILGEVPAINLLRLKKNQMVRFVGKTWRISDITNDGIDLIPAKGNKDVYDFIYPSRSRMLDPFLVKEIWNIIHNGDIDKFKIQEQLRRILEQRIMNIRALCVQLSIPYVRKNRYYRYFTFGGLLVNRAIGLITKQIDFQATDFYLQVPIEIVFNDIPVDPEMYELIFDTLFIPDFEQTIYQTLLPRDIQVREFLQSWLCDQSIKENLERLKDSQTIEVQEDILFNFSD